MGIPQPLQHNSNRSQKARSIIERKDNIAEGQDGYSAATPTHTLPPPTHPPTVDHELQERP
jgi:hypothetical protein